MTDGIGILLCYVSKIKSYSEKTDRQREQHQLHHLRGFHLLFFADAGVLLVAFFAAFGDSSSSFLFGAGESVEFLALIFCSIFLCCGVFGGDDATIFLALPLVFLGGVLGPSLSSLAALRFCTGAFLAAEAALAGDFSSALFVAAFLGDFTAAAFFGDFSAVANSSLPSYLKPAFTIAFLKRVLTLL